MSKKAGVGIIKGVGEKTEKLFEKIGVYTVDDLIHYYPRGYEIFGEPVPISEVAVSYTHLTLPTILRV